MKQKTVESINKGRYREAAGDMLNEVFKEDIINLSIKRLRYLESKATEAIRSNYLRLKKIPNEMLAADLAAQAYKEAWEKLGFSQTDRVIEL